MQKEELYIRDPFVLNTDQGYYLYGSTRQCGEGCGFYCFFSTDLQNFSEPIPAFLPTAHSWGTRDFWAPEVHRYQGKYYLFGSLKREEEYRGTQIFVSATPEGPFLPLSERPVTPADWSCLDGTFYLDPQTGKPWMVFCHEWIQIQDGTVCALPLTQDLRAAAGQPVTLFAASEAPWGCEYPKNSRVTDGPFLFTYHSRLCMLWSTFVTAETGELEYAVGVAVSTTGSLLGPWKQLPKPLFSGDGGHAMLFHTREGQLLLSLHSPNSGGNERARFLPAEPLLKKLFAQE